MELYLHAKSRQKCSSELYPASHDGTAHAWCLLYGYIPGRYPRRWVRGLGKVRHGGSPSLTPTQQFTGTHQDQVPQIWTFKRLTFEMARTKPINVNIDHLQSWPPSSQSGCIDWRPAFKIFGPSIRHKRTYAHVSGLAVTRSNCVSPASPFLLRPLCCSF